jgi:uncharacterized protein (TIGR02266 family)
MDHRRSDRRYERKVALDITYEGQSFRAFTRNISLGGVFVVSERPLPFGARISLSFHIPTQMEPVIVDGQVRWLELEEGHVRGIGIRFEGLRARDVWALNKFFEQPFVEDGAQTK